MNLRTTSRTDGAALPWVAAMLCALLFGVPASPTGAVEIYSENAVKAAFVSRFAGYVEWPEESVPADRFTIAVLGDSDLALRLQALMADRKVMRRPVQVRRIASLRDAREAQIVYVGSDRRGDLRMLLSGLADRCVLTISAEDDALAAGSMINLLVAEQRMRFEVSMESARRAQLKISAELLQLAVRVQK